MPREFPGVRGFGLVSRVARADVDAFVAAQRADGAPGFAVRTSGHAADLYVVTSIEPVAGNQPAMASTWAASSSAGAPSSVRSTPAIPPSPSAGLAAIAALQAQPYDLVLMDMHMPELDGLPATQRIRRGEAGEARAAVPVIAMTASALPRGQVLCLQSGMNEFITKPVALDALSQVLRRWLNTPPATAA